MSLFSFVVGTLVLTLPPAAGNNVTVTRNYAAQPAQAAPASRGKAAPAAGRAKVAASGRGRGSPGTPGAHPAPPPARQKVPLVDPAFAAKRNSLPA